MATRKTAKTAETSVKEFNDNLANAMKMNQMIQNAKPLEQAPSIDAPAKTTKEAQAQTEIVATNAQDWVKNGKVVSEEDNSIQKPESKPEAKEAEKQTSPEVQQEQVFNEETESRSQEDQVEGVETAKAESLLPDELSGVEIICNDLDDLGVDELKEVIEYCSSRIEFLQREEVEALEQQMRAIQDKLIAMKGFRLNPVTGNGNSGQKRTDKPLINPKNPTQVYTFGKTPEWLSKWMTETGKTVAELREAQAQQSKAEAAKAE